MRIHLLLVSLIFSFYSLSVVAGDGHDHGHDHSSHSHEPISETQAGEFAVKSIEKLINKGKIADSWKQAKLMKAEKKQFGAKTEWVVSFNNDQISNDNKKTLYVFLSLNGDYVAANHTGK